MATNPVKTRRLVLRGLAVLALVSVGVLPSALAQDIEVISADPSAAEQATVNLDVTIHGNGFARGAVAKFLITRKGGSGGIVVNRTTFKGSKKLIANIDIEENAEVGGFDIEVTTKGRTGKGIDLFSVQEKGSADPPRALFRDATSDGVRSDEQRILLAPACQSWDYVDSDDPCLDGWPRVVTVSAGYPQGMYFLRTVSNHEPLTAHRWLVLDFSDREEAYDCPGLDTRLIDEIDAEVANNPSSDPLVRPPEHPDSCIDYVEVRFYVDDAFSPSATQSRVAMLIDQPVRKRGKGKNAEDYTQWDAMFALDFVNPLTLTRVASDTVTVGDDSDDDFQAELWTFDNKGRKGDLLGIFIMKFQLTITLVQ